MIEKATIARPYAKAVFECATELKSISAWSDALRILAEIAKNNQVLDLLRNNDVTLQKIVDLFLDICKKSIGDTLGESLSNFVLLLAHKKRLELLPEIEFLYQKMCMDAENRIDVNFESPIALSENQRAGYQEILEKYLSRTVTLQCEVNTKLLGGYVAKAGNFIIDGSIRGSLVNLKTVMGE